MELEIITLPGVGGALLGSSKKSKGANSAHEVEVYPEIGHVPMTDGLQLFDALLAVDISERALKCFDCSPH